MKKILCCGLTVGLFTFFAFSFATAQDNYTFSGADGSYQGQAQTSGGTTTFSGADGSYQGTMNK